jgi:hypothetical protein
MFVLIFAATAMAILLRCRKDVALEYRTIKRVTLLQQQLHITSETVEKMAQDKVYSQHSFASAQCEDVRPRHWARRIRATDSNPKNVHILY